MQADDHTMRQSMKYVHNVGEETFDNHNYGDHECYSDL